MQANEAKAIAEKFIASQDNRGFSLQFVESRKDERWGGEWSAVFDVYTSQGALIDGPVVVIVNEESLAARYL